MGDGKSSCVGGEGGGWGGVGGKVGGEREWLVKKD